MFKFDKGVLSNAERRASKTTPFELSAELPSEFSSEICSCHEIFDLSGGFSPDRKSSFYHSNARINLSFMLYSWVLCVFRGSYSYLIAAAARIWLILLLRCHLAVKQTPVSCPPEVLHPSCRLLWRNLTIELIGLELLATWPSWSELTGSLHRLLVMCRCRCTTCRSFLLFDLSASLALQQELWASELNLNLA